jgi:ABC-type antimicrobial peptide transport system permease subunit
VKQKKDVQQGTLAQMVLQTLDVLGPLHGYGISRRIEQISGDQLAVNQGTLYPRAVEAGLLAAMLVVTGIFGVGVYTVRRRTRELGIRLALGARKAQVMRAAVARPMVLLGAGSFLGLLAAILASHLGTLSIRRIRGIPWWWAARC